MTLTDFAIMINHENRTKEKQIEFQISKIHVECESNVEVIVDVCHCTLIKLIKKKLKLNTTREDEKKNVQRALTRKIS